MVFETAPLNQTRALLCGSGRRIRTFVPGVKARVSYRYTTPDQMLDSWGGFEPPLPGSEPGVLPLDDQESFLSMVWVAGLEPGASGSRSLRSTSLSYTQLLTLERRISLELISEAWEALALPNELTTLGGDWRDSDSQPPGWQTGCSPS